MPLPQRLRLFWIRIKNALGFRLTRPEHWLKKFYQTNRTLGGRLHHDPSGHLTATLTPPGGQPVHVLARPYPSSDLFVLRQVFALDEYGPVLRLLRQHFAVDAPLRVLDAGANVGYTALWLKSHFPQAQVVCLEPDSGNFAQLEAHLALNPHLSGIQPIRAGLWRQQAFLEVHRDFRDGLDWSVSVRETDQPTDLRGYGVADLRRQLGWAEIDLLKIDIEGSERYVFETDEAAAAALATTRLLALEIHDEWGIRPAIEARLTAQGFRFFNEKEFTVGLNTRFFPLPSV